MKVRDSSGQDCAKGFEFGVLRLMWVGWLGISALIPVVPNCTIQLLLLL